MRFEFLKAWAAIKETNSLTNASPFWTIASYYGQPFKQRTEPPLSAKTWGGYSNHENVLFPTWNRVFLKQLEDALASVPTVNGNLIALHYWDETSEESLEHGLPNLLTKERVTIDFDGNTILNPLLGYTLPKAIPLQVADTHYSKPKGYHTKRYPYSGIMDPKTSYKKSLKQNHYIDNNFKSPQKYLQENIYSALNYSVKVSTGVESIQSIYKKCLLTEKYNTFSNIQSSIDTEDVSLEFASIRMQLTLGGVSLNGTNYGLIGGANGDIATNHMAAFDPLFYFHLANIDRVFWKWQLIHDKSTEAKPFNIEDIEGDRGLQPEHGQGPTPYQNGKERLSMESPLEPFTKRNDSNLEVSYTSNDCIDIVKQLDYSYSSESIDKSKYCE